MADCGKITSGRGKSCKSNVGGYKNLYLINQDDAISFVVSANTALVTSISGMTVDEAFQYEVKATTNTLTIDGQYAPDNGTTFYQQNVVVNLAGLDLDMTNQLHFMSIGSPWAIVEDYNGNFILLGKDNGVDVTAGQILTGGAMGDFSGYIVTLTGNEKYPQYFLSTAAIATLKANTKDNV